MDISTRVMDEAALEAFIAREFPQAIGEYRLERLTPEGAEVRLMVGARHLRPGGTVSGPALFGLADVAFYYALLARIGPVGLAVTTNGAIDFLRKPAAGRDVLASVRLLKLGRSLAVGDVLLASEGLSAVVARASFTYSIPPK